MGESRPDLTAERFVPDPFIPEARIYRTGDLGRWRADGRLEHVGRVDFQLKLHGLRIEIGEVEAAIERLDEVSRAVVDLRAAEDRRHLFACVGSARAAICLPGR